MNSIKIFRETVKEKQNTIMRFGNNAKRNMLVQKNSVDENVEYIRTRSKQCTEDKKPVK